MLRQQHALVALANERARFGIVPSAHEAIEELPVGAVETDEEEAGRSGGTVHGRRASRE